MTPREDARREGVEAGARVIALRSFLPLSPAARAIAADMYDQMEPLVLEWIAGAVRGYPRDICCCPHDDPCEGDYAGCAACWDLEVGQECLGGTHRHVAAIIRDLTGPSSPEVGT